MMRCGVASTARGFHLQGTFVLWCFQAGAGGVAGLDAGALATGVAGAGEGLSFSFAWWLSVPLLYPYGAQPQKE